MAEAIDILENDILELSPQILKTLLKDHSVSHYYKEERNIIWATHDYESLGAGYGYHEPILHPLITGARGNLIQPRAKKSREVQQQRITDKAEVFTPAWICNKQNNLVDNAWFGREGVFNTETDTPDGQHLWQPTDGKIEFPEGKTWTDYVRAPRLEVACGEAPYLVSRYDATACESLIPVRERIGLLDRKLRIVGENTETSDEWLVEAFNALHSTYGFEWQGDNLLLAREAVLYTFKEYYEEKFRQELDEKTLENAAYIISWNLWQMDGIKCVVPDSCASINRNQQLSLFGDDKPKECPACQKGTNTGHTGIRCEVVEWRAVTMKEPHRTGSKRNTYIYPNLKSAIKE